MQKPENWTYEQSTCGCWMLKVSLEGQLRCWGHRPFMWPMWCEMWPKAVTVVVIPSLVLLLHWISNLVSRASLQRAKREPTRRTFALPQLLSLALIFLWSECYCCSFGCLFLRTTIAFLSSVKLGVWYIVLCCRFVPTSFSYVDKVSREQPPKQAHHYFFGTKVHTGSLRLLMVEFIRRQLACTGKVSVRVAKLGRN